MGNHHTLGTQKQLGKDSFMAIPNSMLGIEHRMGLIVNGGVAEGRISLNRFLKITAATPTKTFGLYQKEGTIAPGADADIVIFDANRTHPLSVDTHNMDVDYSVYEGVDLAGQVGTMLSKGKVIISNGQRHGARGDGRYLRRGLSQYLV